MAEMQRIIDAEKSDLFDVLAHVAYALPTLTRAERAGQCKSRDHHPLQHQAAGVPRFRALALCERRRATSLTRRSSRRCCASNTTTPLPTPWPTSAGRKKLQGSSQVFRSTSTSRRLPQRCKASPLLRMTRRAEGRSRGGPGTPISRLAGSKAPFRRMAIPGTQRRTATARQLALR